MNRTVGILACVSAFLIAAAIILGRIGMKATNGLVPVVDPGDMVFGNDGNDTLLTEIAMILLLAGLSTALATLRCWIQNRGEREGFSRQAREIIPRR